jgi:hypothetical protein
MVKTFYSNNTIRTFEPEAVTENEPEVEEVKVPEKVPEKIPEKVTEKIAEIPPRKGTGTVRALQGTLFQDNVVRYGYPPGNTAPTGNATMDVTINYSRAHESDCTCVCYSRSRRRISECRSPSAAASSHRSLHVHSSVTRLAEDETISGSALLQIHIDLNQERLDEAKKHTQKEGQVKVTAIFPAFFLTYSPRVSPNFRDRSARRSTASDIISQLSIGLSDLKVGDHDLPPSILINLRHCVMRLSCLGSPLRRTQ